MLELKGWNGLLAYVPGLPAGLPRRRQKLDSPVTQGHGDLMQARLP